MILPILSYGNPILKKKCDEIDSSYPNLKNLLQDMWETMYNAEGVGLAAPQINKSIRVFLIYTTPFFDDDDESIDNKEKIVQSPR